MPETFSDTEFTGERVVPGQVDPDLFNEHFSRYAFARRYAAHRRVLDLGCGTGYGAAALAEVAESVTGVDSSAEAIAYAKEHFGRPNLTFEVGDATAPRSRYDLVTAFEVIEHLEDWQALLQTAHESIADGGVFIVSTPNKPVYAESRGPAGGNPFHTHEFEFEEFLRALTQVFPHVGMLVQNHSAGLLFAPVTQSASSEVDFQGSAVQVDQAQFFVAVCTLRPLEIGSFFWIASSANLLRERDQHIALLAGELALKTEWNQASRAELAARNREYQELLELQRNLKAELEERNRWALEQDTLLLARDERIGQLQLELESSQTNFAGIVAAYEASIAKLEQTNREKTEWALETERRLTAASEQGDTDLTRAVAMLQAAEATIVERTLWAQGLDRELRDWQARWAELRRSTWVRAGSLLRLTPDRT